MSILDLPARDDRAAVEKAMGVLEALGSAGEELGLSKIARRAGLPKSTAFRLLGMLQRTGAVARVGSGYQLGPLLQRLGATHSPPAHEAVRECATPFLVELYEQSREAVHLAVLHRTDVVYLNKLHGLRRLESPSRIGGRLPAHATALGKAMLSRNAKAAALVLAGQRNALTSTTITDEGALERELAAVRDRGVAFDSGESHPDLLCIAAPIVTPHGHSVAAISVAGPRGLFVPQRHEAAVRRAAYRASRALAVMNRQVGVDDASDMTRRHPA